MKLLAAATRALTPLALLAAVLALIVPWRELADRSDLLLAALVLATALGISGSDLLALRRHAAAVATLSIAPLVLLAPAAWALGQLFDASTRDGLLAVGLSSSEVASVGLAALAGADATIALGAVTGSLVLSALLGPVAIGWLAGHAGQGGSGHLLVRFALVVILPLIAGVALRSANVAARWLRRRDAERDGVASVIVALLVYAALSGTRGAHGLGAAFAASLAFLIVSAGLAAVWQRGTRQDDTAVPGAMVIAMRDFAVAAALASQAFGNRAAAVPGVYGVVMLLAGSAFVTLRTRRGSAGGP
ncbi:MAG TPA: bile acid:sodium symporter [Solirubrobacteraceae bacterium]|nr:bile acid:sodium symporter [Solirubrobacteraceae bacterium]